jgi:hypothetical protein
MIMSQARIWSIIFFCIFAGCNLHIPVPLPPSDRMLLGIAAVAYGLSMFLLGTEA